MPQGIINLRKALSLMLADNDERLYSASKKLFTDLQDELAILDKKIEGIEIQLKQLAKAKKHVNVPQKCQEWAFSQLLILLLIWARLDSSKMDVNLRHVWV